MVVKVATYDIAYNTKVAGLRGAVAATRREVRSMPVNSHTRNEFLRFRKPWEPGQAKLILIAESPPASGKYFYKDGRVTEPLFAALMKEIGIRPPSKEIGLERFRQLGVVLLDATYTPINAMRPKQRNEQILADYPNLLTDLRSVTDGRLVPIVLIKANVCVLLEAPLLRDGFNVRNAGTKVFFPSSGRQSEFSKQFRATVEPLGLELAMY